GSLGSGIVFPDEAAAFKELTANAVGSRVGEGASHINTASRIRPFTSTFKIAAGERITRRGSCSLIVRSIADNLRTYEQVVEVGVIFLQALNHFQRYAYVRQAHARESRMKDLSHGLAPPPHLVSRTPSNRSEVSLGGM
ncbi:hypothetical protein EDB19DRAFT_1826875, partial [Suillus lakei]